jgi:hypothetical protein
MNLIFTSFWRCGHWKEVIIDDRLPTVDGKLMFMQIVSDEFWAVLLEKAYAKFYGSFEAIEGGKVSEAMIDFTGGINEHYDLNKAPHNLFNIIKKALKGKSLVGAGIGEPDTMNSKLKKKGLVNSHAYSISKAVEIPVNGKIVQIVKIRNPWGNDREWNGIFSDKSEIWKSVDEETKAEIEYTNAPNGEFFMTFEEFKENFTDIDICHVSPESFCNDGPEEFNKCFETMELSKQYHSKYCGMIVSLSQKNRRSMKARHIPIEFYIYKLSKKQAQKKILKPKFFSLNKPIQKTDKRDFRDLCEHFILKPGYYAIIPRTTINESEDFAIRIFTKKWMKKEKDTSCDRIIERQERWKIHPSDDDDDEKLFYSTFTVKSKI